LWHAEKAIELDPYNPLYHGLYSMTLAYGRRWDDAIAARRTADSMVPGFGVGFNFGEYLFVKGLREEELANEKKIISNVPELLEVFERGLAEGGYEGAWRAKADWYVTRYNLIGAGPGAPSAFVIAFNYLRSGNYDLAVEWFWRAYEDHIRDMPYVGRPTVYDRLHSHPRYRELLRKLNLPVDLPVPKSGKR
jgi:tetratricopeptide (TPR) repeat protein